MREILFKNLMSVSSRKKNIFLKEIFEKDGMVSKTERRCFYFIRDIAHFNCKTDIRKWMKSKKAAGTVCKRQFYIMKEHSDSLGEDKISCKITGTLYLVVGENLYTVSYLQSFKMTFMKATLTKGG